MSAHTGRPVDDRTQDWIESSLRWFVDQFGARQLCADVAVPTARFVPAAYAATTDQIEQLVSAACTRMGVGRKQFDARQFDGSPEAADPIVLLAVIARELARVRLIGERRIPAQRPDTERLADLLTVFCGYGVFSTNGAMRLDRLDAAETAGQHRLGYLKSEEFGYALSCYAWLRRETNPAWARYVNAGTLQAMRRGLEYLSSASAPGQLPTQQPLHQNVKVGAAISVVKTRKATTSFGVAMTGVTLPVAGSTKRPPD
jgi:hypothetical protein